MNYLRKLRFILLLILITVIVSCEDEDAQRIPFDEIEKVVNMRIQTSLTSFDQTSPEKTTTLTFFTENNNVDRVDLFIQHSALLTEDITTGLLATIEEKNIGNDGNTQFTFSLLDAANALNLDVESIFGGDVITVFPVTTLTDGRVFPDTVLKDTPFQTVNVTPNIINSNATTSFTAQLPYPIVCPLPEGFATGSYQMTQEVDFDPLFFGVPTGFGPETVNITATSNTGRSFNYSYLPAFGGFASTLNFDFACSVVLLSAQGTGATCSAGISVDINLANVGTFNIEDDNTFTISILNDVTNDCGQGVAPTVLRFTKN